MHASRSVKSYNMPGSGEHWEKAISKSLIYTNNILDTKL